MLQKHVVFVGCSEASCTVFYASHVVNFEFEIFFFPFKYLLMNDTTCISNGSCATFVTQWRHNEFFLIGNQTFGVCKLNTVNVHLGHNSISILTHKFIL